jgi:HK97 family phage portal protein
VGFFSRWMERAFGPSGEMTEKAAVGPVEARDWWQWKPMQEPWTGAFQQGFRADNRESLLASGAVYACTTLIANDIAKLRIKLVEYDKTDGIWTEQENASFSPVLRKPNTYQTRIQFLASWVTSKLMNGNAYVLKERDARNVVIALYVLDPNRVTPLVTEFGDVYYQLGADPLSGFREDRPAVRASEIIHDRMNTFFHPLVGVSPLFACTASATLGNWIHKNSQIFFANMSRPSGILTGPHPIDEAQATMIKQRVEEATSGANLGRLLLAGNGLEYQPMTMSAVDAQLIDQLKLSREHVADAFHVPLSKLGGTTQQSARSSAQDDLDYYKKTLQRHIEDIEILLDEGLGLGPPSNLYGTELDLDGLLRMDPETRAKVQDTLIRAAGMKPNEVRRQWDLPPVEGGDACYLQQQNFSLEALAKRDAREDPFATATPARRESDQTPPAAPAPAPTREAVIERRELDLEVFARELEHV